MHKVRLKKTPSYINNIYNNLEYTGTRQHLRGRHLYNIPKRASVKYRSTPAISAIEKWTTLPNDIKNSPNISLFKARYKKHKVAKIVNDTLTSKINIPRVAEIKINKLRSDLALKVDFNRHNFPDSEDVSCQCDFHRQTHMHFLLDCPFTAPARGMLVAGLLELDDFNIMSYYGRNRENKLKLILYGDPDFSKELNRKIMSLTASYVDAIMDN